jgi:hypothetical protein
VRILGQQSNKEWESVVKEAMVLKKNAGPSSKYNIQNGM